MNTAFLRRMTGETTWGVQPDLPFPKPDPADLIDGPRVPLRYGSAATQIWVSKRQWRRSDGLPGHEYHYQNRWRTFDDYTDTDNVEGKRARVKGTEDVGIVVVDDEGFLSLEDENGVVVHWCLLQVEDVEVIPDETRLNKFERALKEHLGS